VKKRVTALAAALLLSLVLSGCSGFTFEIDPEKLYTLPELPAKYTELNAQINAILEDGAEYAAPTSGTNIQPVQMTDLDGDGQQEAVAFFRKAEDEKPLKIHIFSAEGDRYEQSAVIEGSGASVYSVVYSDLDGDGRTELIVGWRVNAELQTLSVYALSPAGPAELLRSVSYVRYAIADLNGDGLQELVILHSDEEGESVADYYDWQKDGGLQSLSSVRLSVTMAELNQGRVVSGALRDGLPAVFVTGVTTPVSSELTAAAVTDILVAPERELSNAALSSVTGVTSVLNAFYGLYPTDINGDGAIEVPSPAWIPSPPQQPSNDYQRTDWMCYDSAGEAEVVQRTYHAMEDGWYLRLPEEWTDQIYVSRTTSADEAEVVFYARSTGEPILRITALTGSNRELRAARGGRFSLSRQNTTIYTAELSETAEWEHAMTAEQVRTAFSLIAREWIPGDN